MTFRSFVLPVAVLSLLMTSCRSNAKQDGIELILPQTEEQQIFKVTIFINEKSEILYQEKITTIQTLTNSIKDLSEQKKPFIVLLKGHKFVDYTKIVEVLQALRTVGVTQVSIALPEEE